jgi:hypothetical protein
MTKLALTCWARWIAALSVWPLGLARTVFQRPRIDSRHAITAVGADSAPEDAAPLSWSAALAWPFDLVRAQHAAGVQSGLIERSLIASAAFERRLGLLERLTLGPLARKV